MSQVREPSPTQDLFKSLKLFVFNTADHLARFLKGAALIVGVASILLVFYSALTQTQGFPCPPCQSPLRTAGPPRDRSQNVSARFGGPTNISHLVFGIGGSAKTWVDRRRYSELWWQPNITRGFVWLDEKPDPNITWPANSPPYRVSADWTQFKYSSSQSAVRIARIVLETFRVGLPDARWFVMGDDDTVFFTDNLVSVLAKYDHNQMYYIGGNSESVEQDVLHSYDMAFGGGGFAISYPLAAELSRVLDGCLDRYYNLYGSDQRVWACVNELGVSLTRERGFHQIDVREDAYGLLAAHPVAPLVSLHHLDGVNPLFPGRSREESLRMLIRAYQVDPAQILQQSFCYDHKRRWSLSISWGYTAQIYPSLVPATVLATPIRTFRTWRSWSSQPFTFNTRDLQPDPCEQPLIYFLDKIEEVREDQTRTIYAIRLPQKKCGHAAMAVQRIVVSASKMDPQELMASRRRCCDIGGLQRNSMRVTVRTCEPGETITT
ncbi:O-fucosylpeptide 3-beta-N-acetylglucosaminyltransferase [Bertholletia excelsa]